MVAITLTIRHTIGRQRSVKWHIAMRRRLGSYRQSTLNVCRTLAGKSRLGSYRHRKLGRHRKTKETKWPG